jgi:hypothetical protein
METVRRIALTMRWNVIWLPLPILLFLVIAAFDGLETYRHGRVLLENWTWGLLLSPASDIWIGLSLFSIGYPLQATLQIPLAFDSNADTFGHPVRTALIWTIAVPLVTFFVWVLLWGSFPLESRDGHIYMRLVPFIPWPSAPF